MSNERHIFEKKKNSHVGLGIFHVQDKDYGGVEFTGSERECDTLCASLNKEVGWSAYHVVPAQTKANGLTREPKRVSTPIQTNVVRKFRKVYGAGGGKVVVDTTTADFAPTEPSYKKLLDRYLK